jgi:hypothetical protein
MSKTYKGNDKSGNSKGCKSSKGSSCGKGWKDYKGCK